LKVSGWLSCRLDGWISIYPRVRRLSRFGRDVNRAYLWIGAAIAAGALGTFLQAIGAAKPENRALLALGMLLTAVAVYFLWTGQRILSQQATAKPVLDVFVDGEKTSTSRISGPSTWKISQSMRHPMNSRLSHCLKDMDASKSWESSLSPSRATQSSRRGESRRQVAALRLTSPKDRSLCMTAFPK
jgi:hypothetical protein